MLKFLLTKTAKKALMTVLLLTVAGVMNSFSQTSFVVNNLNYTVSSGTNVTLTGYTGTLSGTLTIPSTVSYANVTYTVTAIGDYSFWYTNITGALVIPNTVTYIGEEAFEECEGLTSLTLGSGVQTIAWGAFYYCTGLTGTLTIPESVSTIQNYAFFNCTGLSGVVFNATNCADVPGITDKANMHVFDGCPGIYTVGTGVTRLPKWIFPATGITQFVFNAVNCADFTNYADVPFCNWSCLASATITIGSSVQHIPAYIFLSQKPTGSLVIPNSVTSIGDFAFSDDDWYQSFQGGTLTLGTGLQSIGQYAFYTCRFVGELNIPSSVTTIGQVAFCDCSGFTGSLILPEGLTSIEWAAFAGCSGFTGDLYIPNSVTSIGNYAFNYSPNFAGTLTIGTGVQSINKTAFNNCHMFSAINYNAINCADIEDIDEYGDMPLFNGNGGILTIGESVTRIPKWLFHGNEFTHVSFNAVNCADFTWQTAAFPDWASMQNTTISIGNNVTRIPAYLFYQPTPAGSLVIPNSVTSIGDFAFCDDDYCYSFQGGTLTLGTGLQSIGQFAFYCCRFGGSLNIPNSVNTIGQYAFCDCTGFTGTLTIPSGITTISQCVFGYCTGLTGDITIANNVTSIANYAFIGCTSLNGTITIGTGVQSIGNNAFKNCSSTAGIVFNAVNCADFPEQTNTYTNYPFEQCGGFLTIGDAVTHIPLRIFKKNNFTGTLTIGESITEIDTTNFQTGNYSGLCYKAINCADVTYTTRPFAKGYSSTTSINGPLTFGNNVQRIPAYMFAESSNITGSLTLPSSLQTIGDMAFYDTRFTGDCVIPNSVTSIGATAFCDDWEQYLFAGGTLTLGSGLQTIGNYAFAGSQITGSLVIPNSVTSLGNGAFSGCQQLNGTLTLSENITAINSYTFWYCRNLSGDLNIPNNVQTLGNYAFGYCDHLTGALTIGTGVQNISNNTFYNCHMFSAINFNATNCNDIDGVEAIADMTVFDGNGGTLTIGSGVTRLPKWIFHNGQYTHIDYNAVNCADFEANTVAFPDWNSLQTATIGIGEGVTHIPARLFNRPSPAGSLVIPNSVISIGDFAFCDDDYYQSYQGGTLTLGNSLQSIGQYAFYTCRFVGELNIPSTVTTIGQVAFCDCSGLTGSLILPEGLTSVEWAAFAGLSGMTGDLYIPNSVTSIGNYAFNYSPNFAGTLTIGTGVQSINKTAFNNCHAFSAINYNAANCADIAEVEAVTDMQIFNGVDAQTLTIGIAVTRIPQWLFHGANFGHINFNATSCADFTWQTAAFPDWGSLASTTISIADGVQRIPACLFYQPTPAGDIIIPNSVTEIGNRAFCDDDYYTSFQGGTLTLGDNVQSIGEWAFYCCQFTNELQLPSSLTTIGQGVFNTCNHLTGSVIIPFGVTAIENYTFGGCTALNGSIFIPETVTSIGNYAFSYCYGIHELTLGSGITSMGQGAFNNCYGITEITSNMQTPPSVVTETLYNITRTIPFHIPYGTLGNYQTAPIWQEFTNYIVNTGVNITVTAMPAAGGTVTGGGEYQPGDPCTITATATTGYTFVNWTQAGNVVTTEPEYSFTVTIDASYIANFSINTYEITATADPAEGGIIEGAGTYNYGATATLTATPATGYSFVNWTRDGQEVTTEPTLSFTVTEAAAYVAHFSINTYEITVAADPEGHGTVTGGGTYNYGETATLTATPNSGYLFAGWTENGELVSEEPSFTITVTEDHSFVAHFDFDDAAEIAEERFSIYPNPATDIIHVECNGMSRCEIYNTNGALVYRTKECSESFEINVSDMPKGTYIIKVSGDSVKTQKLIIK